MHGKAEALDERAADQVSLATLWWMFLRIACTSFGGFMAMVSVVQNVVVERRQFLSDRDVVDGLSLASVLPGPVAINMVAYVGYRLRGAAGALVCVCAAVAPAFVFMILLSAVYFRWGQSPAIAKVFMGVVPVMAAIIMAAAWRMGRASVTGWREGVLATGAAAASVGFSGFYVTLTIIVVAAIAGWRWFREPMLDSATIPPAHLSARSHGNGAIQKTSVSPINASFFILAALPVALAPLMHVESSILLQLSSTFAGMSMLMFGGGYVFIPLLQQTVVDGYGWVTHQEFVDAVAMGQVTPGPIMVSATFIGFKVAGLAGAAAATAGMFAPTALLTVLCARILDRVQSSAMVKAALHGVRAAVVGMVFSAAVLIGKSAAPVWISGVLFVLALLVLVRYRIEAVWIVPVAGLAGFFVY